MKVLKATPGGMPRLAREDRPVPSTNRNKTGWMSPVTARSRSLRNLISSRRHTITAARRSWRTLRSGTDTLMVSVSPLVPGPASDPVIWVAIGSAPSAERLDHAAHVVGAGGLGVADGPAGVGHEH